MCSVQSTGYGKANLVNYTKSGRPFWCEIQIQPIISKDMYGDEQITHLLGTLVKTATVDATETSSCSTSPSDRGERDRHSTSKFTKQQFQNFTSKPIIPHLFLKGANGWQALVPATARVEVWVLGTVQAIMEETAPLGTVVTTVRRKWATNALIHPKTNWSQQKDPDRRTIIYCLDGGPWITYLR